ncbi:MAG TPA: HPr(Ser) kinase/phosphatase [Vicinamibacterales bacterium]|nr:HPr(Ser) kinase/phosphatase [Vicinamibacterales bacterium]
MSFVPSLSVAALLDSRPENVGLTLELLAGGAGVNREITSPHVQKTGLALAGFQEFLKPGRILILGDSEIRYLEAMESDARLRVLRLALRPDVPCVVVTNNLTPPADVLRVADEAGFPLLRAAAPTPTAVAKLSALLDDNLAERTTVHGVLVDVLGLGVLVTGESGIGKSECALDLIVRGHRLVADDTVEVRRRSETILIGICPEMTRHHMELRGLGVINVKELFGIASIRSSKRVELVVQLERWNPDREYERVGLDDAFYDILGLRVPMIRMPVAPGRNIAILVEVAARNQLLRSRGYHAARELAARLDQALQQPPAAAGLTNDDDEELESGDER